ncbi:type VII secretion-associated serine protease mycosin [Streptomyces sp. NPDC052396]|uniref:type VII secretion-associated serine protease mycosin n=1 Tax=Streptomyces sp. NPDC052396 TaxID=3365689 RepID=UPI0037D8F9C2
MRKRRSTVVLGLALPFLLLTPSTSAQADSVRSQQWYLDAMDADEMWKTSTGSGITVAVVDTGVQADLPGLRGQVLPGRDFSGLPGGATSDYEGHGTMMAEFVAANGKGDGGEGGFGLAPGAKILPVRVVTDKVPEALAVAGHAPNLDADFAKAIRYAADSDARIISISLANTDENKLEAAALNYALAKGKLVFAAAGNSGQKGNYVLYPAAHPGVVGVGAVNKDLEVTAESERGPQVALVAPGDDMHSSCKGGTGVCASHGTSDATALASAAAALVWSKHPDWTANQVLRVLINTAGRAQSGEQRNDKVGYGLIRPRIALKDPGDPGPANVSPLTGKATSDERNSPFAQLPESTAGSVVSPTEKSTKRHSGVGLKWVACVIAVIALGGLGLAVSVIIRRRRAGSLSTDTSRSNCEPYR